MTASRLGRRPKRLKEAQDSSLARQHHVANIAPYPPLTPQQLSRLSMAELQRLLQSINGGKKPSIHLPPSIFKFEPQALGNSVPEGSVGGAGNMGSPDSESGYSSHGGGDTPSSSKSHSPITSQVPNGNPNTTGMPAFSSIVLAPPQSNGVTSLVVPKAEPGLAPCQAANTAPANVATATDPAQQFIDLNNLRNATGMSMSVDMAAILSDSAHNYDTIDLPFSNGDAMNGHVMNGHVMNGHVMNGHVMNGHVMNGHDKALSDFGPDPQTSPPAAHPGAAPSMTASPELRFGQLKIKQEPSDSNSCSPALSTGACNLAPEEPSQEDVSTPKLSSTIISLMQEALVPPSGERRDLITQVVDTVLEAHLTTCNYTLEKVATGMARYRKLQAARGGSMPGMVGTPRH